MENRVNSSAKWECVEPFVSRVRSQYAIYSVNELQQLIRYERARSDREKSAFSVAVFDIGQDNGNGHSTVELVADLKKAVRATDHVGWYGCRGIGVVLPATTEDQAMKFAAKVHQRIPDHTVPSVRVFSYHDGWLKRWSKVPDNGGGNGNGNGHGGASHGGNGGGNGNGNGHGGTSHGGNGDGTIGVLSGERVARLDPFCPLDRGAAVSTGESLEEQFARKMPPWKRSLDVVGSLALLFAFAPLFLVVGIYTKLASPGPIIFKQKRVGYRGRAFDFYKFRTMKQGNDQSFHGVHAEDFISKGNVPMTKLDDGDRRITRGGRILRRASIDELPQLLCVLKGDMSLVGPRPCIEYEAQAYLRWHTHRFDTVPGMTGLWQVNGKNARSFKEMVCFDIAYSRNMSLSLDLKLLAATIPSIAGELRKALKKRLVAR